MASNVTIAHGEATVPTAATEVRQLDRPHLRYVTQRDAASRVVPHGNELPCKLGCLARDATSANADLRDEVIASTGSTVMPSIDRKSVV